MATVTKTFTENMWSSNKATWTVNVTGTNQTVTGSTFTVTNPTVTAKYSGSNKGYASADVTLTIYVNGTNTYDEIWYNKSTGSSTYDNYLVSWASGTQATLTRKSSTTSNSTASFFNSNNKTTKTVNITATSASSAIDLLSAKNKAWDSYDNEYTNSSAVSWGTIATLTLNAPPNVTASALSKNTDGYYKDATTVSCTLSGVSAQYGGDITETKLTIGSQTATGSGNGTLSITLNATGTFTPTVTVTDSRGQVTTRTLADITVTEKPPTFTVSALSKNTTDYYAGLTTVSCTISSATAYGGTVSSSKLTIGSQTATGTGNGTLSITLNATGTFTPTVQITDSNGLTTTKTLTGITVVYSPPVCTVAVTSASPYIRGYTAYTVNITGATAYGGTIASIVLNVGGQTATGTGNGTLSVTPTTVGTYTPTVVITDSNGKSTTKTLSSITVQEATPPTFTAEIKSSGDYIRTISTYTVEVKNATASYSGTISSIVLTLGSQTASRTTNGTLSITPNTAGTFTPTVTVTDNRGLNTTQEMASMTVLAYDKPSMSITVMRTNSSGVADNEGTYGLITATINYTKARANLNKPTTTVTTEGGTSSTPTVTWYTNYSSSSGVSNAVNWTNYNPNSPVTLYGLINGSFTNASYTVSCSVSDSLNQTSATITQTIPASFFSMDVQAGGKEIAFGLPANDTLTSIHGKDVSSYGYFKCGMEAQFEHDLWAKGLLQAENSLSYGVCDTASATVAKTVTVANSNFTLQTGATVAVKFTNANSASNPTLNVNSTGAVAIKRYGTTASGNSTASSWQAGSVVCLLYDGTYWQQMDWNNSTYNIESCCVSTASATQAKVGSLSNYALQKGHLQVAIYNANTYEGAITLNINSTGAKPIYINGSASSATNYTLPKGMYLVYYNGTNFYFRTDGFFTQQITNEAPSSESKFYPVFTSTNGGVGVIKGTNDAFPIWFKEGTASADGYAILAVGNATATGTANNSYGTFRVYGKNTGYGQFQYANSTSNTTHTLPATGGTVLNTGTTSYTATQTSGTALGTLKINGTNNTIYAPSLPTVEEITVTASSTTTGTFISADCFRYGKVVMLRVLCRNASSVAAGGNILQATMNTNLPAPAVAATAGSYYSSHATLASLSVDRVITLRNASSTAFSVSGTNNISISFTYITND